MTDKYKASNGRRLTQSLFYEFNNPDAPYSLRDEDFTNVHGKTYPSMARIYRESVDEYDAAIKLLGSYAHWRMLAKLDWFANGSTIGTFIFDGLNAWREEMSLRDASSAKDQLMKEADAGNVSAQRYIHERASKGKPVGRPETKKKVKDDVGSAVAQFAAIQGGKA